MPVTPQALLSTAHHAVPSLPLGCPPLGWGQLYRAQVSPAELAFGDGVWACPVSTTLVSNERSCEIAPSVPKLRGRDGPLGPALAAQSCSAFLGGHSSFHGNRREYQPPEINQ